MIAVSYNLITHETCLSKIALMYDCIDYSSLISGATFNIIEGTQVVGTGVVL
jgi:hypothetical protein